MTTGQRFRVTNATRSVELAGQAERPTTFAGRGFGLMGRKRLPGGTGMVIEPCNSVVTFFMRFPIDVIFVARDGAVLHIIPAMRPWRLSKVVRGSRLVVELPAGTAAASSTVAGHRLEIAPA